MEVTLVYEIIISEELNTSWEEWFEGMTITQINGKTSLKGLIRDQSDLHGIIRKIQNLGLTIISINPVSE